jgi:hypothetical protein
MRLKASLCAIMLAMCASQLLRGQAVVNEGSETAFIYVDAARGSDSNPGTQVQPLKTISAASADATLNNYHSVGTLITINPGVYRETISIFGNQYNTAAPVTFQGAGQGVIISGSVQYANWQAYSDNAAIYTAPWPNKWGLCSANTGGASPFEQEIVLRREMIFVNGKPLTQVLAMGQMQSGTFFVTEAANLVYIWPAAGVDISTSDVEVATLPESLRVVGRSNLVFRGLNFQYANSCRDQNAVDVAGNSHNILFDSDSFSWNNAIGLHFFPPVSNFTVLSSSANHNGQSGMMSVQTKFGLWQSVVTSFNNWRGAQGAYYYWNSGGMHFFSDHDHTITGAVTAYNQTHGIHFDTDNANITVNGLLAAQNLAIGVALEKNEGPVGISNSTFCSNNLGIKLNYLYQAGLVLRNSEQVTLGGNLFYNNRVSQIMVIGVKGGIEVTNWETGQTSNLLSQALTYTGNTSEAVGGEQVFSDSYLGGTDWSLFASTLNSNNNIWWNASNDNAFEVPVSQVYPLSGWQSVTGQDALSSWAQPANSTSPCAVSTGTDYWLLSNSPSQSISPAGNAIFSLNLLPFGGLQGTASLTVDGIQEVQGLSGALSTASVPLTGTFSLSVNSASNTLPGTYPITVIAQSGNSTRTVTASLVVPATSVRLSTVNLTFAGQKTKTTSSPQTFTLTNVGNTALAMTGFVASSTEYVQSNNCGATVAAGATCTAQVMFTPRVKGARKGTLQITDKDGTSPQVVSLLGTGD